MSVLTKKLNERTCVQFKCYQMTFIPRDYMMLINASLRYSSQIWPKLLFTWYLIKNQYNQNYLRFHFLAEILSLKIVITEMHSSKGYLISSILFFSTLFWHPSTGTLPLVVVIIGAKYSRMDQLKFVEHSL